MRAAEINAMVKMLNASTDNPGAHGTHAKELAALRTETEDGRPARNATMNRIQEIRNACCLLDRRHQLAQELNANRLYNQQWRFEVRNGRLVVEAK